MDSIEGPGRLVVGRTLDLMNKMTACLGDAGKGFYFAGGKGRFGVVVTVRGGGAGQGLADKRKVGLGAKQG